MFNLRRVYQSRILQFLCTAVHAVLSFLVSFSPVYLLFLFLSISSCLGYADQWKEKAKEPKKRELHKLPRTQKLVKSETTIQQTRLCLSSRCKTGLGFLRTDVVRRLIQYVAVPPQCPFTTCHQPVDNQSIIVFPFRPITIQHNGPTLPQDQPLVLTVLNPHLVLYSNYSAKIFFKR